MGSTPEGPSQPARRCRSSSPDPPSSARGGSPRGSTAQGVPAVPQPGVEITRNLSGVGSAQPAPCSATDPCQIPADLLQAGSALGAASSEPPCGEVSGLLQRSQLDPSCDLLGSTRDPPHRDPASRPGGADPAPLTHQAWRRGVPPGIHCAGDPPNDPTIPVSPAGSLSLPRGAGAAPGSDAAGAGRRAGAVPGAAFGAHPRAPAQVGRWLPRCRNHRVETGISGSFFFNTGCKRTLAARPRRRGLRL